MLLINTTMELAPGQFSPAFKDKIQCLIVVKSSLSMHYIVVHLIHTIVVWIDLLLFQVLGFGYIFYPPCRNFIRTLSPYIRLPSNVLEDKRLFVFRLFVKEIASTSVYVLFAFLSKCFGLMNNNFSITSLDFRRWIIEGTCAEYLFFALFWMFYMEGFDILFDEYQLLYLCEITLKIAVYILMRCAESWPDFFLNHLESYLLISFCEPDSGRKLFFYILQKLV